MIFGRLGSLNALEQTKASSFWSRWVRAELPSADTVGRVFSRIDLDSIRDVGKTVYSRLKRNKAIRIPKHGLMALVWVPESLNGAIPESLTPMEARMPQCSACCKGAGVGC